MAISAMRRRRAASQPGVPRRPGNDNPAPPRVQKARFRAFGAEIRLGEGTRRRHDEGVRILVVVLVAGLLIFLLRGRTPARAAGSARARRGGTDGWWLLGALLLGVLLLRLGMHWLAVAGGVGLAVMRTLGPLLRWLPLVQHWQRQQGAPAGSGGPNGSRASEAGPARQARMTRREALQVLGLDDRATREDVQREYRRLIKRLHPDLGGSTYLTAKLNEARDVLS
jgi:DnaJ homolog subfamily C member 19